MSSTHGPEHKATAWPSTPFSPPAAAPDAPRVLLEQLWGRLGEIDRTQSGGQTTLAASLIQQAQQQKRPVAWVQAQRGPLYPPDLAEAGVDVASLIVVQVGEPQQASQRLRAAEWLLMRGAFGLVIVDVNEASPIGEASLGRLLRHVRQYRSSLVLLTRQADHLPSLGALVSLRMATTPLEVAPVTSLFGLPNTSPMVGGKGTLPASAFDLQIDIRKSKTGPLPGPLSLVRRGPLGL